MVVGGNVDVEATSLLTNTVGADSISAPLWKDITEV